MAGPSLKLNGSGLSGNAEIPTPCSFQLNQLTKEKLTSIWDLDFTGSENSLHCLWSICVLLWFQVEWRAWARGRDDMTCDRLLRHKA